MKGIGAFQSLLGVGSVVFGAVRGEPFQIGVGCFLVIMGLLNIFK